MYMRVCTYARVFVCACGRMGVFTYVRVYVCACVRMRVWAYLRMYVCTYARTCTLSNNPPFINGRVCRFAADCLQFKGYVLRPIDTSAYEQANLWLV